MEIMLMGIGGLFSALGAFVVFMSLRSQHHTVQKMGQVVGFSHGPNGTKQKPDVYRTVLRFQGIDGEEHYVVDSAGSLKPAHVMGEFVPILLSRADKRRVYLKSPSGNKWGRVFVLIGMTFILYSVIRFGFNLKLLAVSFGVGLLFVERLHALSKSGEFDWRKWINGGRDLGSLVPPEVFPLTDSKFISWVQVRDELAMAAYAYIKPRKTSRSTWARTLFIVTALCCLGAAAVVYLQTEEFINKAQRATGIVVKLENKSGMSSKHSTFAPIVDFYGPAKRRYRFTHTLSTNPPAYKLGQHVKVLYDLKNPNKAILDMGVWNHMMSMAMAAVGLLFLFFSARANSHYKKLHNTKSPPIAIRRVG